MTETEIAGGYDWAGRHAGWRYPAEPDQLIAVGLRDEVTDAATLAWAIERADPESDLMYLVHAFTPLAAGGWSWQPVARARDERRDRERLIIARALQRLRNRPNGIYADGAALGGRAAEVLIEFSEVVDLIVLGEDEPFDDQGSPRPATTREVQRAARCPVVAVPHSYDSTPTDNRKPITVLVESLYLPTAATSFAIREGERRDASVVIAQRWSAFPEDGARTAGSIARRQGMLDTQLADLQSRHPRLAIIGELILDETDPWSIPLRSSSQLVVLPANSDLWSSSASSRAGDCPTISVPERTLSGYELGTSPAVDGT
jgi:hypothetical protein